MRINPKRSGLALVAAATIVGLFPVAQAKERNIGTLTAKNGTKFSLKISGAGKAYQLIVYTADGKNLG